MANSTVQSYTGPFIFDIQNLEGVVVDVVPGATAAFSREKPGVENAVAEITVGIPVHASTLGVAPDTHTRLATITDQLAEIRAKRVLLDKAAEVLEETEAYLEDEREGIIGTVVDSARRAAKRKDPAVLAAFEKTIQYHGQIAKRAAKTRRKNAQAAEAQAAEAQAAEAQAAEAPQTDGPPATP